MPSNIDLHREMDAALNTGDVDTAYGFMAEDVVVHIPGETAFAGDYHSRDAFFEAFGQVAEMMDDSMAIEHRDILGSDEHTVALTTVSVSRDGNGFTGDVVDICRWKDGKVIEEWLVPYDQRAWDAFWS